MNENAALYADLWLADKGLFPSATLESLYREIDPDRQISYILSFSKIKNWLRNKFLELAKPMIEVFNNYSSELDYQSLLLEEYVQLKEKIHSIKHKRIKKDLTDYADNLFKKFKKLRFDDVLIDLELEEFNQTKKSLMDDFNQSNLKEKLDTNRFCRSKTELGVEELINRNLYSINQPVYNFKERPWVKKILKTAGFVATFVSLIFSSLVTASPLVSGYYSIKQGDFDDDGYDEYQLTHHSWLFGKSKPLLTLDQYEGERLLTTINGHEVYAQFYYDQGTPDDPSDDTFFSVVPRSVVAGGSGDQVLLYFEEWVNGYNGAPLSNGFIAQTSTGGIAWLSSSDYDEELFCHTKEWERVTRESISVTPRSRGENVMIDAFKYLVKSEDQSWTDEYNLCNYFDTPIGSASAGLYHDKENQFLGGIIFPKIGELIGLALINKPLKPKITLINECSFFPAILDLP